MATSAPLTDAASNPLTASSENEPARSSIATVLIAMLAGAVIASMGFGGALYYLARSGRLSVRRASVLKSVAPVDVRTHLLMLDPLLVNLADESESTYVRLSITLQMEDAAAAKESRAANSKNSDDAIAAIRDTALTVLGRQTANALLAPEGKERLKAELLKALNQQNPDLKVKKILFTDFLVQR